MNFFKRDRTFREPIGKLTTFFMVMFHIGAIAALFLFSWKDWRSPMFLWWVAGSLGIGHGVSPAADSSRLQDIQVDGIFPDHLRHAGAGRRAVLLGGDASRPSPEY